MTTIRTTIVAALLGLASTHAGAVSPPATPFLPVDDEAPPRLFVEPPLAAPLADRGAVVIPYRTDNFRIVPVFGPGARDVSPRVGHLHVTVDDLPWHWADAGDNQTIVVVGLPAGPHKVLIELATPEHRVIAGKAISFNVPASASRAH